METTDTIEANGNRHDTVSVAVAGVGSAPELRTSGRNIDGFFRPRTVITSTKTSQSKADSIASLASAVPSAPEIRTPQMPKQTKPLKPLANRVTNHTRVHVPQAAKPRVIHVSQEHAKIQVFTVRRGPANHTRRRALQHSRTLRRDAVSAPELSTHNTLKPKGVLQHVVPGLIAFKKSAAAVDPDRLARAQNAPKSALVARHGTPAPSLLPTFAPVAVQPMPTPATVPTPMPGNGGTPAVPTPITL